MLVCCLQIAAAANLSPKLFDWRIHAGHILSAEEFYRAPRHLTRLFPQISESQLRLFAEEEIAPAALELALRLIARGEYAAARLYWRPNLAKADNASSQRFAELLLNHGQWGDLDWLMQGGFSLGSEVSHALALHLKQAPANISKGYADKHAFMLQLSEARPVAACQSNVLLLADQREGIIKLREFAQRFARQPEPYANAICLVGPVYVGDAFACSPDQAGRADCQWQRGMTRLEAELAPGFSHIVMMTQAGSANVRGGIMHIAADRDYGVFLHELMHFNGFEDEYPLPEARRMRLCRQGGRIAPNLFVRGEAGLSPPMGWSPAASCKGTGFQAFKPGTEWSVMEYYSEPLSAAYRELWRKQLENEDDSNPYFADYFRRLGDAAHWRNYALQARTVARQGKG